MNVLKMTAYIAGAAILAALTMGATIRQNAGQPRSAVIVEVDGGHGSGVHLGHGVILTAAHVVDGEKKITIRDTAGTKVSGKVVAFDKDHDLALVDTSYNGPSANLSCLPVKTGDHITISGNPFDLEFITTWGRVAGATREIGEWPEAFIGDITTAPGNSGSPVYNTRDEVVGVLVGGFAPSVLTLATGPNGPMMKSTNVPLLGLAFIVPATTACHLMGKK